MHEITFNGEQTEIQEDSNVLDLLNQKDIKPEVVAVEINDDVIDTKEYENQKIEDGDNIEVVYFMGGGSHTENRI